MSHSGGHALNGQGGYYGSGGSRAALTKTSVHRPEAVAHAEDVSALHSLIPQIEKMESMLHGYGDTVDMKTIELKSSLKKLVTQPKVMDVLSKLEFKGEPVWGLSEQERELVQYVRRKVNEC